MIDLAGGASTQSRARRPLPAGAVSAVTIETFGARETVDFRMADGTTQSKTLLSWVIGQSGCLWGGGPLPDIIEKERGWAKDFLSGAYGHQAEHDLAAALSPIYEPLLGGDLSVRFFQNAGDACSAAARVARAHTKRQTIASYGYHGAHLDYAHEPKNVGVPDFISFTHKRFEWGDVFRIKELALTVAAIVVEVPPVDDDNAREFLSEIRAACDWCGAVMVLDDTVLGFRLALGGSCEYYGVRPDIVILGKAMSATGCVSAVLGKRGMVGRLATDVFYSTTFGGAPGPCAIAAATANWLREHKVEAYGYSSLMLGMSEYRVGHLRHIGKALKDGLNSLGYTVIGQPERSVAIFDSEDERRAWCSRMIEQGIIVDRPFFPTLAHTMDDVTKTLEAAKFIKDSL